MTEVNSEWLLWKTGKNSTMNQNLGRRIKENIDDFSLSPKTDQIKNSYHVLVALMPEVHEHLAPPGTQDTEVEHTLTSTYMKHNR
jgi:hypothetical protein